MTIAGQITLPEASQLLKRFARWAMILGVLIFYPLAILLISLSASGTAAEDLRPIQTAIGAWYFIVSALLLGHPIGYALTCIIVVATALFVMFRRSSSWLKRVVAVVTIAAVGVFIFAPYQPSVQPADGYKMLVPTMPSLPLRGLKRAQAAGEAQGCAYELLGWQGQTLFYSSSCCGGTTWIFAPAEMRRPQWYTDNIPTDLHYKSAARIKVLNRLHAKGVYPQAAEESVRDIAILKRQSLYSPNQRWLATVAQYTYGPQDVLVLERESRSLGVASVNMYTVGNGQQYPARPISLRKVEQYPFKTLERAASPNGEWEAVVVARYYGPSDIVIVRRVQ